MVHDNLSIVNRHRQELPGPRLLHELISNTSGKATAIDFLQSDGKRNVLTYATFASLSRRLCERIRRCQSRYSEKQHIIPVIIPQCPELYIAWRAVLEAGAGFCPVSPNDPQERLKFILRDVSADLVLCLEESLVDLRKIAPSVECLTVSVEGLKSENDGSRRTPGIDHAYRVDPKRAAYVQYTSGSSGLPKGVVISHRSVTQCLLAHDEHIPIFKRFLQFASPTFDVSIFEVFFPFFRGATLVGCSREEMLADLPGTIRRLEADTVELTPTVAGTLLRKRSAAPCLKFLLTIGEMLNTSVVAEFGGSRDAESMLYALYGPTEAVIHCTLACRLAASDTVRSIGLPLSTVTAFVIKETVPGEHLEIVPIGVTGELAVAGQLADGYLHQPEQDKAAFTNLPNFGRIYRTGDRAVCTADGQLEILGRMTSGQVKLRGQRVELGEIEEVASRISGLSLAMASVVGEVLVLFCVAESEVTRAQIRATCKAWLPSFMRPGDIVILEGIVPRLPSGKVNKKQLEADYQNQAAKNDSHKVGYVGDDERRVIEVLQEVLGQDIARSTNLWSAGMDSLRAIKVASKLRGKFSVCSIATLLEAEDVDDVVAALRHEGNNEQSSPEPKAPPDPNHWSHVAATVRESLAAQHLADPTNILPCSSMQIAMLTETSTNACLNFNSITIERRRGTTHDDVWQAMCQLAVSNELLRSGFCYTGDSTMPFAQVVLKGLERHELDLLHPLQLGEEEDATDSSTVHIHHALYDGWSWELILDDLNAILASDTLPLRPSFQAFADHQKKTRLTQSDQGLDFWKGLKLQSGVSALPCLASGSQHSSRETLTRDLDLSYARLSKLAEDIRVSRQAILQSCWARLLSVYNDSSEVIFGSVTSGRHANLEGVDQIIGPCLSTLPMKAEFETVNTFQDLVTSLHRQNVRTLEYSNVSLHAITKRFMRSKDAKAFDTLFLWQQGDLRSPDMRRYLTTACTRDSLDYGAVLEAEPNEGRIKLRLTVDTRCIPAAHARLLLDQLNAWLSVMMCNSLHELRSPEQWECTEAAALSIANPRYQSFDNSFDLFTTIARLASEDPSRPALRYINEFDPRTNEVEVHTVSYGTLYEQACMAAGALTRQWKIGPDDLVCVIAEKSVDLYVTILAIIMTGAGYMCIDPKAPKERVKQILQYANCAAVLIDEAFDASGIAPATSYIHEILNQMKQQEPFMPRGGKAKHLAYCVWTSGTTGKPKGVLVTLQNLLSNIAHLSTLYPCNSEEDALLQACSPAFDVSVFEIFWTWHMGMVLSAVPNDILFRDIEKLIDRLNVTHLSLTPSVAALVRPENVPKVKMLVTAGEPMNSKVFNSWAGRGLYQGYGPSETTNICNVRPNVQPKDAANNVGPALPNTSVFVCRRNGKAEESTLIGIEDFNIVPKGALGEIWIGGDQVARGYVDPDLTARSFLDHPTYGRLYRSGDIGRLLADDSLVILGREDDQAKVRGQRIELGEINSVLLRSGVVDDAVSLVLKTDGQDRLLSFCRLTAANQSASQVITQMYQELENILPTYMVPDTILPMERLPLTGQGKVDNGMLAQRYREITPEALQRFSRRGEDMEQIDELDYAEQEVAKALAATLDIPVVGIRPSSSFYALGLDSISCIRLSQLLNRNGFRRIDVSTILQNPSIKLLKPILTARDSRRENRSEPCTAEQCLDRGLVAKVRNQYQSTGLLIESVLPCTDIQLSMLSSADISNAQAYLNTLRLLVKGDLSRLRQAWDSVKSRQPLLRTAFVKTDASGMPYVQVVFRDPQLQWHSTIASRQEELLPYSLKIHRDAISSKTTLILEVHHALYDAEAMSALLDEVQVTYWGQALPAFAPFTRYLEYMINLDQSSTDHFWSKLLAGIKTHRLADIIPRARRQDSSVVVKASLTSRHTTSKLRAFAHNHSTTLLTVLQASLARLLSFYCDVSDICFGNVYSGRSLPISDVERIIGPCFNTLPVRVRCQKTSSNLDIMHQLQRVNVEIMPVQPSSPRRIQRQHSPDGMPLFDVLLLLQQGNFSTDSRLWELLDDLGDMRFPFLLEVLPSRVSDELELSLHSEATEENILIRILRNYDELLSHTISFPQARAGDFASVSDDMKNLKMHWRKSRLHSALNSKEPSIPEMLSDTETKVKQVMRHFARSGQKDITKQTTIFQLGLDSINAVQIAAKLREAGHQINSAAILESPSLAEIAAACSSRDNARQTEDEEFDLEEFDRSHRGKLCERCALDASLVESVRPCTPTQCGILSEYLKSGNKLYYNTSYLRLEPTIDKTRLARSWQEAITHHEMLRTGFVENESSTHPFIMITYKVGTFSAPVIENNSKQVEGNTLTQPPWHLSIQHEGDHTVLAVSMLHALYDAQSMDIILASVAQGYNDSKLLPEPSISRALSSILSRCKQEGAKDFWQQDRSAIKPTKFPDLNISSCQRRAPSTVAADASLSFTAMQESSADLGCSPQVICQAAWAQVLAAYIGQQQVTFGLVLSGRDFGDERDAAVFPCINTVPFTIDIGDNKSEMLKKISKLNAGLVKYQYTPLTSIKRWQGVEGETFDTILVLQKFESKQPRNPPWQVIGDQASAEYAISVEILLDEDSNTVKVQATYSEQVLPSRAAQILLGQYNAALCDILSNEGSVTPKASSQLSILPEKEKSIPTDVHFLHEFVEKTAAAHPRVHALEFITSIADDKYKKMAWTYSELNSTGNRVAALLVQHDVCAGDLVAICFDKCSEASFAILGILKAGAAYVAIDPEAPLDRKAFILKDAGCKIVLTTRDKGERFTGAESVTVISLDNPNLLNGFPSKPLPVAKSLSPEDTCYCLYTSGTTGTPKGCLISHRNAVQAMMSFRRIFHGHWAPSSRWLQFASFHFDVSVLEQYWSWGVGICVVSAPRDIYLEDLPGFINRNGVTHLALTPSLARLLSPEEVPTLCQGVFIVGGEPVSQDIIDTWGDAQCLYNFYGPSEVTIGCTVHPRVIKGVKPTNIGQQFDNVGSFVLEPDSRMPVIKGAIGELCLSGALVGKGYLNRQALTNEKFVELQEYGTRVYRTGDLVRLLHDNSFEYLGRIDDQVKLRGQRLETGEINQVIRECTREVKSVATLVVKHPVQGKDHLVAFFSTASPKRQIDLPMVISGNNEVKLSSRLRQVCIDKLPGYMNPARFVMISYMPLSPNNKIDAKILRNLYENSVSSDGDKARKEDETSGVDVESLRRLTETLGQFLSIPVEAVRPYSRLFELGIDSVSAIPLAKKLKSGDFGEAKVVSVLRHSTVIDLARALSADQQGEDEVDNDVEGSKQNIQHFSEQHRHAIMQDLQLRPEDVEHVAPCTPLQEGMVSKATRDSQGSSAYFTQLHLELGPSVDPQKMREAWRLVQKTTSILRTHLVPTADGFAQATLNNSVAKIPFGPSESTWSRDSLVRWVKQARNFGRILPWHIMFSPSFSGSYMTLFIFHGLYDGISLPLLLQRVAAAYSGQDIGPSNFYEVLPYGPLLRHSGQRDFWRSKLKNVRILGLHQKHTLQSIVHAMPSTIERTICLGRMKNICTDLSVTEPAIFHCAWLLVLHEMYGINPTLGIVASGRVVEYANADGVIGPMINTLACTIEGLSPDSDVPALVKACHRFNIDVLPYQQTALRDIAKWIRHDTKREMFDCLFVFQREKLHHFERRLWKQGPAESFPDYPLNLEVEQKTDGSYVLTLVAKQGYLDSQEAGELLDKLEDTLHIIDEGEEILLPEAFITQDFESAGGHDLHAIPYVASRISEDTGWNAVTEMVRTHFVELSGVASDFIGLNKPTIFELGLDSIDAMKLATRLRADGFSIPVSKIMHAGTVAGVASVALKSKNVTIGARSANDKVWSEGSISNSQGRYRDALAAQSTNFRGVERILPVTPMQEGLLLDFEIYYNMTTFELDQDVDIERLKEAWKQLVRMHPMLRTKFIALDGPDGSAGFLQAVKEANPDFEIEEIANQDLVRVANKFEETLGTLKEMSTLRIAFVKGYAKHYMVTAMPHAAYDAWSLQLLHQRLAEQYRNTRSNTSEASRSLESIEQYLDTVTIQASSNEARHFWQNSLKTLHPTILRLLEHGKDHVSSHLLQRKSGLTLSQAQQFCMQQSITMQSLGLACWSLVLAHYAQSLSVCFGLVLSGRTTEGSDQLVFPTFNTVIFSSAIQAIDSRQSFVRRCHKLAVEISEYQHFPLREATKIVRSTGTGSTELFNSLFTYQKGPKSSRELPSLYSEVSVGDRAVDPPYAVNVEMEAKGQELWWTIATQENIAKDQDVEIMLRRLDFVLNAIIQQTSQPVLEAADDALSICGLPKTTLWKNENVINDQGRNLPQASAEWTPTETKVREVLAELAKTDESTISKFTGLYELGLDSISAIRVSSLLKTRGIRLPVSRIVEAQTVEKMATLVERHNGTDQTHSEHHATADQAAQRLQQYGQITSSFGIDAPDVEDVLPATAGQTYMLGTWSMSQGRLAYPNFWLGVEGIPRPRLEEAIHGLREQIPMLRTTFIRSEDGSVLQVVLKPAAAAMAKVPWLYHISEKKDRLLLTWKLHHALYDAVSLQIMMSELQRLCIDKSDITATTNRDMATFVLSTAALTENDRSTRRSFWTTYLEIDKNIPVLSQKGTLSASRTEKFVPRLLQMASLEKTLRREGLGIQSLLVAACARVYAQLLTPNSGRQHVILGMYLANRSLDIDNLPSLTAPTFNVVPLKVNVSAGLVQAAKRIQDDLVQISKAKHCGVSLGEIHGWTGVKVDCVVNFLRVPEGEEAEEKLKENGVRIRHAPPEVVKEHSGIEMVSPNPFFEDGGRTGQEGLQWVLPSIDIEAKVENGSLGLGVFAPEDMLDEGDVESLISSIRALMVEVD